MPPEPSRPAPPSFREALGFWLRLGFISFGGPAGQIAILHRELVERRRWIGERHFLHALNYCMLLPGPEAQQLATYLGWRFHGALGGIAAGGLFVLPGAVLLLGLAWAFMLGGDLPWFGGLLRGLVAAVLAVILEAVIRIGRRSLRGPAPWALALLAFLAIRFGEVPFVVLLALAAAIGFAGHRVSPGLFPASGHRGGRGREGGGPPVALLAPAPEGTWRRALGVAASCLALWWAPVLAAALALGGDHAVTAMGVFFSQAALVTFGGAYAVLPYVAQQAVEVQGWVTPEQMMAGLALAETTPGPLVLVLPFVAFVGAWQHAGSLDPAVAALLAGVLATWVTFLPSFLFIFLGGPHVERLGEHPRLAAALGAITAAVVGVILDLAVGFGLAALLPAGAEGPGGIDLFVAALAVIAFAALVTHRAGLITVIAACGLAGLVAGA